MKTFKEFLIEEIENDDYNGLSHHEITRIYNAKTKDIIDDVFIALTGYSFKRLQKKYNEVNDE
jgi:hypothetical protein